MLPYKARRPGAADAEPSTGEPEEVSAVAKLKLTQVRSQIGQSQRHRGTLRALGLGRIGKTTEHDDEPGRSQACCARSAIS